MNREFIKALINLGIENDAAQLVDQIFDTATITPELAFTYRNSSELYSISELIERLLVTVNRSKTINNVHRNADVPKADTIE